MAVQICQVVYCGADSVYSYCLSDEENQIDQAVRPEYKHETLNHHRYRYNNVNVIWKDFKIRYILRKKFYTKYTKSSYRIQPMQRLIANYICYKSKVDIQTSSKSHIDQKRGKLFPF